MGRLTISYHTDSWYKITFSVFLLKKEKTEPKMKVIKKKS